MNKLNDRRDFIKACGLGAAALALPGDLNAGGISKYRPNILWLVSEDNSPFLGCYGDSMATTPNLDRLAKQGIRFTNAYANAPVCAPARTTLITGMYASCLGAEHMRSSVRIPRDVKFFTEYLREAGYYCTNSFKTDYNCENVPEGSWDDCGIRASWKSRKPGQPFFSVINYTASHESCLHRGGPKTKHDQAKVKLAPYHPDTPEMRHDYARYYDQVGKMDADIGKALDQLEKDGLAEDTIVFYFSDHGGVLPRSKRWLYDSGMHVPMIVRFPKKFRHFASSGPGSTFGRLVSFIDFAPTVLSLAGLKIPDYMQGSAFFGARTASAPEYVFGFRGRMDSRYDTMRCVRDKNFKYIRNYIPHLPYSQHIPYHWRIPSMASWQRLHDEGRLSGPQQIFFSAKPAEELYDINADPHEINNLAADKKYRETLARMREATRKFIRDTRDPGLLPEAEMHIRANGSSPREMALDSSGYDLDRILKAAEISGERAPFRLPQLIDYLEDEDSGVRYWGAIGCLALGAGAKEAADALVKTLDDPSPNVRIASAEALCNIVQNDKALELLVKELGSKNVWAALHAANSLDYLDEKARPVLPEMKKALKSKSWHMPENDIFCSDFMNRVANNAVVGSPVSSVMKKAIADLEK